MLAGISAVVFVIQAAGGVGGPNLLARRASALLG